VTADETEWVWGAIRNRPATAVRRIDEIFAIERRINGQPAGDRLAVRRRETQPIVVDLETWMCYPQSGQFAPGKPAG